MVLLVRPIILSWLVFVAFSLILSSQHRMAVPTDIKTPNVPPPCSMDFPTRPISSLPLRPALKCLLQ